MRRPVLIKANTIDVAAEEILGILEGMSKHERNVYFHGWRGLGASTTLRVVAQRLKSSTAQEMKFDKVLHVDCSLWQSMRALQKSIAEELELPQSVMAMFDQHDEGDDFDGIDQGSRGVILDVTEEIFRKLVNSTFVVIFHNRSGHYVDLYECGVPVTAFLRNKLLWTWGRRFQLFRKFEVEEFKDSDVDVIIGTDSWEDNVFHLHEEATEVAKYMGILEPDVAWEVGDALQRNINLDWIMEADIPIAAGIDDCISSPGDRWVSATHQALLYDDIGQLPPRTTSFFLLPEESVGRRVVFPAAMFPDNNTLRVLHLSWCTFSFTSPPFLCCNHLRFLLLDHCTDVREEEDQSNNQNISCFKKLWVLDLRYTEWYSKQVMCLMVELRELNVEGIKDWVNIADLCGGRTSLLKLRVTADLDSSREIIMQRPVANLSSASNLNTVILDNCVGLEQIVPDVLPQSLESFTFVISDAAIAKISRISFRGLAKLKSMLLRGLMGSLQELDLSGTALKTVDLREVVANNLKRLILLGCEKLRAIQWPPRDKRTGMPEVFRIDTIRSASSIQANWEEMAKETSAATKLAPSFDTYISIKDARLLRSLVPIEGYFWAWGGHVEMDSLPASSVAIGDGEYAQGIGQPGHYLYARDIIFQDHLQAVATSEGAVRWMWAFPPVPVVDESREWYIHVQDEEETRRGLLQREGSTQGTSTGVAFIPDFMCQYGTSLHVHDSLSITSIQVPQNSADSTWTCLEWCRIERCPKLSSVFATPTQTDFDSADRVECFSRLTTFWASQLSTARYIWNWSRTCAPNSESFTQLKFLHLDYCPRLIHVLPLSVSMTILPRLVTLEIVCCGNLMEIFPLDPELQEKQKNTNFPSLRHIHLHDLPKLQRICGSMMLAPKLETIKTRGCWSLRRLPAVAKQCPEVDCEKELWDSLEWDDGDANHRPSLYKLSHSRYYKKAQLPRGTVLR